MLRRAGLPVLLLALGLAAGVLVARVPPDFERSVVTRRHHGSDPLQTAVFLRFNVESLLSHPSRYFQPPFLYPDPNPQRGTEPLVAESLLAIPFRLVLGDRPAPVFTVVRIVTLALLALMTGLMLRELGARPSLATLGGGLSVLVATTAVFLDRLQAVSLQWLPLAVLFASRSWRRGRALDAVGFGVGVFLTLQASLYTAAMLLAVAPFLAPLLWTGRRVEGAVRRGGVLAMAALVAGLVSLAVLWPWLQHRADVAAYATPAFMAEKSWGASALADPFTSPPEWPLGPAADWDGVFPGFAFVLMAAGAAILALAERVSGRGPPGETPPNRPFVVSGRVVAGGLLLLVASIAWSVSSGGAALPRVTADALVWIVIAAWYYRLAVWPNPWTEASSRLRLLASAASFAALLWFLFSLGSPARWTPFSEPAFEGLFGPVASVLSPLREMRELKRFLLPAGWAAVVALVLVLERALRGRHRALAPVLAVAVLAVGLGERLRADTRKVNVPRPPAPYSLLADSTGTGGLLELPFDHWGRIKSVHRMLWQPSHGRPVVAGKTGIDPGWYTPARDVFNEFPSEESLLLMRAWGLDTVLERRREPRDPGDLPESLAWRGRHDDPRGRGEWGLMDLLPRDEASALAAEPTVGPGEWLRPRPVSVGDTAAVLATDGSAETSATVEDPVGLVLSIPGGVEIHALELDYGPGRFNRVPPSLRVLGLESGGWRELTSQGGAPHLRARAAHLLLTTQAARLVVPLRPSAARQVRLVSPSVPWDVPEVRVRATGRP
jgi:hypothetical protein